MESIFVEWKDFLFGITKKNLRFWKEGKKLGWRGGWVCNRKGINFLLIIH